MTETEYYIRKIT